MHACGFLLLCWLDLVGSVFAFPSFVAFTLEPTGFASSTPLEPVPDHPV